MSIETILRSQPLPITVAELIDASGIRHELVYVELVRLEGEGKARPIINRARKPGTVKAGWIYLN